MSTTSLSIDALNRLDQAAFTDHLAAIYEHSPWIPQRAWSHRPFADRAALAAAMAQVLAQASRDEQLGLIRAHPELAGKAALRGDLTDDSKREQSGAGLDQCSPEEFAALHRANRSYGEKFGFPFIIAVKGLGRREIIAAMESRLARDADTEFAEALAQIRRIADFRLADKVTE
ncbi:2-oxo-4-hydroxy-4-carboxy-5-ureidoimidazoline decarboxylase [Denitratisoma sp. agr-D3]